MEPEILVLGAALVLPLMGFWRAAGRLTRLGRGTAALMKRWGIPGPVMVGLAAAGLVILLAANPRGGEQPWMLVMFAAGVWSWGIGTLWIIVWIACVCDRTSASANDERHARRAEKAGRLLRSLVVFVLAGLLLTLSLAPFAWRWLSAVLGGANATDSDSAIAITFMVVVLWLASLITRAYYARVGRTEDAGDRARQRDDGA